MRMPDKSCGFTLLELIISLTIIAIIVMVIQNGFHISVRAWEKGESAVDRLQRYRVGLELIQEQLSSAFPVTANENVKDASGAVFKGDESSLEFSSCISLVPGIPSGMVRVWYRVETEDDGGKTLSFSEERFFPPPSVSVQAKSEAEQWHVILSGVKEVGFEYMETLPPDNQTDEESFWQPSWVLNQQGRLPLAVRVRFQADEKSAPFHLVFPVGRLKG